MGILPPGVRAVRETARTAIIVSGDIMESGLVALFERKVLFRIARFVAFTICFLLFLGLLAGGTYLLTAGQENVDRPDPAQVAASLKPVAAPEAVAGDAAGAEPAAAPQLNASVLRGLKVPPVLQELLLAENNQRVFKDWLDELPDDERQAFIDGAARAIEAGRKEKVEDADVLNAYRERFVDYVERKQAAEALVKSQRLYVAGAFVSTLMLLALFSLVLVLLAIERNTRAARVASA